MNQGQFPPASTSGNPIAEPTNPYAAPQAEGDAPPIAIVGAPQPFAGLWRQGKLLVMHKNAPLPEICLKSNEPATRRIVRKLQWHHPAIALTLLMGVLVYVILAVILTKRATIYLPLTETWHQLRRRRVIFAWVAGLSGLGLCIGGFLLAMKPGRSEFAWLLILGIVISVGALLYGQYATALVRPKRMTDEYIWLKGVHPEYLNRLEIWQWNI